MRLSGHRKVRRRTGAGNGLQRANILLSPHLRCHLLLYDTPERPAYGRTAGIRLLWIVALLALSDAQLHWLPVPASLTLPYLLIRLALVVVLARFLAGIAGSAIGFRPLGQWTVIEKSFLVQMVILVNLGFPWAFSATLNRPLVDVYASVLSAGLPVYFIHGFTQELVYRGMLQTELTRRWGTIAGVLASNVLYTFGPLHADYYLRDASAALPMFAAVFAMGLLFALHFHRSGNLWIVGIMHGMGQAYIAPTWTGGASAP